MKAKVDDGYLDVVGSIKGEDVSFEPVECMDEASAEGFGKLLYLSKGERTASITIDEKSWYVLVRSHGEKVKEELPWSLGYSFFLSRYEVQRSMGGIPTSAKVEMITIAAELKRLAQVQQ